MPSSQELDGQEFTDPQDGLNAYRAALVALEREILAVLERIPGAIRVREGGGMENLAASLAVTVAAMRAPTALLDRFGAEVAQWAEATFPGQTAKSKADHLVDEARELADAPDDGEEMADVLLLLLHIAHMQGVNLMLEARKKLEINKRRQWGPADTRGVHKHVS